MKLQKEHVLQEELKQTTDWFKPAVGAKSVQLADERRPPMETMDEKLVRLCYKDADEMQANNRRRAQELYGTITFKPVIDPVSKLLGRASTMDDLAFNHRGHEIKAEARRKVEQEVSKQCTFNPQINELSRQMLQPSDDEAFLRKYNSEYSHVGWAQGGNMCPLDGMNGGTASAGVYRTTRDGCINMKEPELMAKGIRNHMVEKENKRLNELMCREVDELKNCTFRPDVETSLASLARLKQDTAPVVVRGLGRYLELKHLTARQKEEAALREQEVFSVRNVERYRRPEDGSTMVQV
jgi:hypothetical protein